MEKIIIFEVGKDFEDLLEVGCIARYNVVALKVEDPFFGRMTDIKDVIG